MLKEFGRFRLLSFDRDSVTRGPTVEVAHESLIGTWPRLRSWVDGRRDDILLERQLNAAVTEWNARASADLAQQLAEQAQHSTEVAQRSTSLAHQQAVDAERQSLVARAKELADIAEVTSALYATTSADRITYRFTNEGVPEWFFVPGGMADVNAEGTQALQSRPGPGLFPNDVDVIDLQSGDVLATISDETGLSGFQWDPVTGEILTLSLAGELRWYDPEAFTEVRPVAVMEGAMFPNCVRDLISYAVLTDEAELDLQTHVVDANSGEPRFSGPPMRSLVDFRRQASTLRSWTICA